MTRDGGGNKWVDAVPKDDIDAKWPFAWGRVSIDWMCRTVSNEEKAWMRIRNRHRGLSST